MMTLRFLLLEDNPVDAERVESMLMDGGINCELLNVETRSGFVSALETEDFDLILADYSLPEFDGISALEIARNLRPDVPFIFVSASLGEELAIETLKRGATDYVLKQRLERLVPCVRRALREAQERRERLRAEAALRQNEDRLRAVAANLPNAAVFIVDHELRYWLAEGEALENAGMTSKDLVGKTLWEALDPALATHYEPHYRQALSGESFSWEHGSHDRYYISHGTPLYNDQDEVDAVLVVSYDITDRKKVEQERERFLALGSDLQMIISVDHELKWVSPTFEQTLGWAANEMIGQPWFNFAHPDNLDGFHQAAHKRGSEQEPFAFENRYRHKDGSYRWFLWTIQPYPEEQVLYAVAVDITERQHVEDERQQAETAIQQLNQQLTHRVNELQTLFDLLPIGVAIAEDPACRVIRTNSYMTELLRMPAEANASHSAPADERPLYRLCRDGQEIPVETLPMQYAAAHNTAVRDEVVDLVQPDGTLVKLLCYASPLLDGQGRVRGALGAFVDITQRVLDEDALRQSESRFRLMVESAKEYAIFTLDLNGIISSWNSGAERLLGYSETEAIGCNGRIIFIPEDTERGQAEREMQLALTQGRAENERWHVRKDGSRFWASGLVMPLQTEAGDTQGFVKILQDKTAQRQADQRLHLLYETTRDLLATDQPMQLMHNLFRKLSGQLALHSYYNYMVEEKDNRPMLHLKNYGGISDAAAESIAWIEMGQYLCGWVAQECRPLILDRSQISTHPNARIVCSMGVTAYAGYPLIAQGRLLGTLSFASLTRSSFTPEEIDLLQSTCEQMAIALERANLLTSIQQQAEQLQQANRIKDEFLAVLSHELRSPLNPILGWSKLLQTGNLNQAKTAQALSVIERNAKLQSELIEDLLDVSRILRGKLSLNVSRVDLVPVIQAAMETVRLAAEAKSIQLEAKLEPIGKVSGDPNRLQQVVWNLLSNAVKFTPEGGRVDIQLEQVGATDEKTDVTDKANYPSATKTNGATDEKTDVTDKANYPSATKSVAQVTITDTGKGIHPDFLPHVFDYFRQEDGATTRKFGGLGLGLAIVRHLVELHGGTIQVASPGEGQGATFTVRLPLLGNGEWAMGNRETPIHSPLPTPRSPFTGLHLLVVDDAADTREFIAFLLETYGAKVTAVASAVEALAALSQSRPDVLISDIGMPEMDGYMLIQQVRALPPEQGGQMPAIALTAYAGEIDYQQAMLAGFQKHVSKPVEPTKLIEAIAELVGQR